MGRSKRERRLLYVWLALCAITVLSWLLGREHPGSHASASAAVAYSALLIAAVKVRVIVREFMEAQHTSPKLQLAMDAWLLLLSAALITIYTLEIEMPPV